MKRIFYQFLLFIMGGIFASPLMAQLPHLIFHAELNGAEQIPAVTTNGKALITLMYSPDRATVTVTGLLVDIEGDVTSVTLHIGKTGEVGAQLVDLMPTVIGRRMHGEVNVPDALLHNLLSDRAYATVSTTANIGGEIRGQFICETDLDYRGILTGAEAVPANGSNAFGFGGIHFPTGSEDIVYAFIARDLSSPVTEVGLYDGLPGQNGSLVHTFPGFVGGVVTGIIEFDELPPNVLRNLREGKYYVAFKTANFPDGEIRGQIGFMGYFTSFAPINPVQQVPNPGGLTGFGFSHNILNLTLDSITTTVSVIGIAPSSVDIHTGAQGTNGPIIETLDLTSTPLLYRKTYPIDAARLTDFAQGRLYINVKTAAHPNGEIRGQMKNSLRKGYAFDLCKEQMVPPTNSSGFGVGMASVDQANCYLNYKIIYDKLSSPITEALVCQAFPTMNGSAIYPLPSTKPIIPGIQEIMAGHGMAIEMGETYVLLVTEDYPNGEIRGQIVRGFSCPETSAAVSDIQQVSNVTVSPVPFNTSINVSFESRSAFDGRIVLYDILGVQTLVFPVTVTTGSQTLSIPTESLHRGYYSMVLQTANQQEARLLKKLIKQD